MLELGSRQNMTGMETKRARGKCIEMVCQICWAFLLISTRVLDVKNTKKTPEFLMLQFMLVMSQQFTITLELRF